ncbi:hypothetical protein FO519_008082 [Halicephalobus sp. NKZ332]|nr:hypothetical protein FO519_008082 [Halicephalobus sp. NKZ332]
MFGPSKASTAQTFDIREDEEQYEKMVEILDLLISAGYYRAKIQGLSAFDKIVGGMVWCLSLCAESVNVDLLYSENSTIGQKISLTENIVKVLPNFKCPHALEPHQIQGLDCIHIFPVMKWLVKEAIEAKIRTGDQVLNHAVFQFKQEGWNLPPGFEMSEKEEKPKAKPRRILKRTANLDKLSISEDVKCTLMEYGHEAKLQDADLSSKGRVPARIVNQLIDSKTLEELAEIGEKSEKNPEQLKNELNLLQKERESLKNELVEEETKLQQMKTEAKELKKKYKEQQGILNKVSPEKLEEIKVLLDKVRSAKQNYKNFKRNCKTAIVEKETRNDLLRESEPADISVVEKEQRKEFEGLSTQLLKLDEELNSANQELLRLRCQVDANPSQLEKNQYQKRFMELYNHMSSTHREIKGLYNLHNMNVDVKNFIKKEIDLLNNIDDLKEKAIQDSYRESFVQNLQSILKSMDTNMNKMTEKKQDLQNKKDKLYDDLQSIVDKQRIYNNSLAEFQEECLKNQQLREIVEKGCIAYGCILFDNAQLTFTYSKTVGAILSASVGVLFILMVSWLKKQQLGIGTKLKIISEAVVLRTTVFGIFCDLLPHFLGVVVIYVTGDVPFRFVGPYKLPEGCIAYGCVLFTNSQLTYTYSRTIGVILNTIIGILFLIITSWLKKKKPEIGTKVKAIVEAVILRIVIFGLICDFIPHLFDTVALSITGDTPFRYIGPFSRVIMAVDLLLSSIMNWLVFAKMKKVATIQITSTRTLFRGSILINTITAGINFVMYIQFYRPELPEGCVATGCLVGHYAQLSHIYSRTIGVVLSTIVGILFLITTSWLKRKKPGIGSKVTAIAEAVVFRAVIFGLIFDFLPHVVSSIWNSIAAANPFQYIGPYSRVIMAVDLLLNSIMNWMVFIKKKKKRITTVQVSTTLRVQ